MPKLKRTVFEDRARAAGLTRKDGPEVQFCSPKEVKFFHDPCKEIDYEVTELSLLIKEIGLNEFMYKKNPFRLANSTLYCLLDDDVLPSLEVEMK